MHLLYKFFQCFITAAPGADPRCRTPGRTDMKMKYQAAVRFFAGIREMLLWDVNNGIARRSWARNEGAVSAIRREMERTPGLKVTLPNFADEEMIRNIIGHQE